MSNASVQAQLLAAVNAKLQTQLSIEDIVFDPPELIDGTPGVTPNSQVHVTPSPTCSQTFDTQIKYNRISLADVAARIFAPVYFDGASYAQPLMLHDVLDRITALTGVELSTDDVVDVELTSSYQGGSYLDTAINLVGKDHSYYAFGTGRMPYLFDTSGQ